MPVPYNERANSRKDVAFTVRADEHGGKRWVRLEGVEFVRRFVLHGQAALRFCTD